jgi:hypothetical protein
MGSIVENDSLLIVEYGIKKSTIFIMEKAPINLLKIV